MTDRETSQMPTPIPVGDGFARSIFPTFNVNVPMPADTVVPGSYNQPAPRAPDTVAPKPAQGNGGG